MNESNFNEALDAMVDGHNPGNTHDLAGFAADLFREQQALTLPNATRAGIAANLGLGSSAPISNRTRRARQSAPPVRQRPRWSMAIAITMAALLAMTGMFQFGSAPDSSDDRFSLLSPAVPTADATPAAIEQDANAWLYPFEPHECPIEQTELMDKQNNPANTWYTMEDYAKVDILPEYGPVAVADPADANAVMTRLRQHNACGMVPGRALPEFWTVRWEYENRTTAGREYVAADKQRRDEGRQAIAAWYEDVMGSHPGDFVVIQDPIELGLENTTPNVVHPLYNPAFAIELGDGRIAVPVSQVVYDDPDTTNISRDFPAYYPPMAVFAFVEGEWRLDETFQICIGECNDFWADELATPVASPMARRP